MYWIEQHTDHKILKLGIKWALYREKKPDKNDYYPDPDGRYFDEATYNRDLKYHPESRIAYLKEPEFRVGEDIYYKLNWKKYKLIKIHQNKTGDFRAKDGKIYNLKVKDFSHYYPGQEVESFKYVKMEGQLFSKGSWATLGVEEWQEVEEPNKYIYPLYYKSGNRNDKDYTEPNSEHTQFQEDVDNGIILSRN